ncbi:hypothetical protein PI124_g11627 [Phytophthora idaei]|nr:hypothetical protein PI126_g11222 [Phytophthora idaei]KAG3243553.1 hypothetical protein PI124_g11627 [Phytophthora idaei]
MTESTVQLELGGLCVKFGGPGVSLDGLGAGIVQLDAALEEAETQDSVVSPTALETRSSGSRRNGRGQATPRESWRDPAWTATSTQTRGRVVDAPMFPE